MNKALDIVMRHRVREAPVVDPSNPHVAPCRDLRDVQEPPFDDRVGSEFGNKLDHRLSTGSASGAGANGVTFQMATENVAHAKGRHPVQRKCLKVGQRALETTVCVIILKKNAAANLNIA